MMTLTLSFGSFIFLDIARFGHVLVQADVLGGWVGRVFLGNQCLIRASKIYNQCQDPTVRRRLHTQIPFPAPFLLSATSSAALSVLFFACFCDNTFDGRYEYRPWNFGTSASSGGSER